MTDTDDKRDAPAAETLVPCPRCGSAPEFFTAVREPDWYVKCPCCGMRGARLPSKALAREAWNAVAACQREVRGPGGYPGSTTSTSAGVGDGGGYVAPSKTATESWCWDRTSHHFEPRYEGRRRDDAYLGDICTRCGAERKGLVNAG